MAPIRPDISLLSAVLAWELPLVPAPIRNMRRWPGRWPAASHGFQGKSEILGFVV